MLLFNIPWGHNILILTKTSSLEEAYFHIIKTIQNGWSRNILQQQIESDLYNRQGKSLNNFEITLPENQSELAQELLKNPYNFDFLTLEEDAKEKDLERELIQHIKKFLLELGKGFAFVGNQHNISVADDDFFLDLLFFNINLNCYVVVELKIGEFKPEYTGKLNFYTNAVDEKVKASDHNPTIGILLCKTPNKEVIKLSLKGVSTPVGVSDYKLTKELKIGLPTKKELIEELEKEIEVVQKPLDKKFSKLKDLIDKAGKEEVKEKMSDDAIHRVAEQSFIQLIEEIKDITDTKIAPLFNQNHETIFIGGAGVRYNKVKFLKELKEKRIPSYIPKPNRISGIALAINDAV